MPLSGQVFSVPGILGLDETAPLLLMLQPAGDAGARKLLDGRTVLKAVLSGEYYLANKTTGRILYTVQDIGVAEEPAPQTRSTQRACTSLRSAS